MTGGAAQNFVHADAALMPLNAQTANGDGVQLGIAEVETGAVTNAMRQRPKPFRGKLSDREN